MEVSYISEFTAHTLIRRNVVCPVHQEQVSPLFNDLFRNIKIQHPEFHVEMECVKIYPPGTGIV
jgi:hypothetical protein